MKFRRLSIEELKELEKEFIQFLSSNTITGPDWEKIKKDDQARADELVDMFSDIVMSKALTNIKYIEHISKDSIKSFWFQKEEVTLIGIDADPNSEIDFSKQELSAVQKIAQDSQPLKIFKTSKKYHSSREEEIFQLLESGAFIITPERFKYVHELYLSSQTNKN